MRRAFTLPELLMTVALIGLTSLLAIPRFVDLRDRLSTHAAGTDVASALHSARSIAWERARRSAVTFDSATAIMHVVSYGDTVELRPLGALYGVRLAVTRDSVTYAPNAMGYGVSNTTVIVARGSAAETLTVSRLGRVKR